MQTIQPVKQGGQRKGAGRPKGSGRYGEATVPVHVPAKLLGEVQALIARRQFTQPPDLSLTSPRHF
jgi:hypothetical protein